MVPRGYQCRSGPNLAHTVYCTATLCATARVLLWHTQESEKLKRSSLILVTENRRDGDKMRAYIKDIPKRTPNTTFYFKVGDEYGPLSTNIREDTRYGDGALVLLHGSPATMKESYSIYGGSIAGLDEMPLAMVYKLIAQSQ